MAHSDKNIIITPNIGSTTADPKIVFTGADASIGPQNITVNVYPTNGGTLSFEGSAGQLFSVTNSLSGVIYSVNDVSGIPSIEVLDTGLIKLAQYSGNVVLGSGTDNAVDKLQVTGSSVFSGSVKETRIAMPANDINLLSGNYFTKTISGATTLTVSNVPASGTVATFILDLTNGGSAAIIWWSGVKWTGGTAPTLTASGRDALGFYTHDGGTIWTGLLLGKDIK